MKISLLSNVRALGFNRELGANRAQQEKALERVSTGKRVNRASDDAAASGLIERLNAEIASLNAATRNLELGTGALNVADGALQSQQDLTTRLRELAVQSASDTLSDADRGILQTEFNELSAEIERIAGVTEFNGQAVLQGTTLGTQVGTGATADDRIEVSTPDASLAGLGLDGLDISTSAGALDALESIDGAIETLSTSRAEVGAGQTRIDSARSNLEQSFQSNAASLGRMRDADLVRELSEQSLAGIRERFGLDAYKRTAAGEVTLIESLIKG